MGKKKIIISIVVILCVLVGIFFVMRFDVIGKIRNAINKLIVENKAESEKEAPEELKYVTEHDKDGNEYVVEYRKVIGFDEEGNEVEFYEPPLPIRIYDNYYLGRIEKIEDNKIYFIVDSKGKDVGKKWPLVFFKDVEDYQVVFDINTYDFEEETTSHYFCDSLGFYNRDMPGDLENFYSADELEFLVGKYLSVQDSMLEDYYTGDRNKDLIFFLK
jgi:hypothetical protein